jgi:hypothetical protein
MTDETLLEQAELDAQVIDIAACEKHVGDLDTERCGASHYGAAGRCTNEPGYWAWATKDEMVPLCEKHAKIPATDGGGVPTQKNSHYARNDEPQSDSREREPTRYERAHTLILSCTDHMCTFRRPYRGDALDEILTDNGCLDADKVPRRCTCGKGIEEELYDEDGEEVEVV